MKKLSIVLFLSFTISLLGQEYLTVHTKIGDSQFLFENVDSITFDTDSIIPINEGDSTNHLSVLLMGSSWGMNTIIQFPILANHVGIDIVVGNLYTGAITIDSVAKLAYENGDWGSYKKFYDGEWHPSESVADGHCTLEYALQEHQWDYIILQRAASESLIWTEKMDSCFRDILTYIYEHTNNYPQILLNTSFSEPIRKWRTREQQLADTDSMNITASRVANKYGIGIIPTATALQNARNTLLTKYGSWEYNDLASDSQHLDYGIGCYVTGCTVFEYICGREFGYSIRNVTKIPTFDEIRLVFGLEDRFTPITEEMSEVAKRAVIMAVMFPFYLSKDLPILYPPQE